MKILWLCPIMLPAFANYFKLKENPKGGWITGSFLGLKNRAYIELCCPSKNCEYWNKDVVNNTTIYTWKRTDDLSQAFKEILLSSKPDIIQIFGTEKKADYDMVMAAEQLGMLDRVVIISQGYVSIASKYHFYCHLPAEIITKESPVEYKYKISLQNQRDSMAINGTYEIEAYKKVKYVVGRTTWDKICVEQINPKIAYYKCNESLRPIFYKKRWKYDLCEKHTIFLSQSHFSAKGFHLVLEAMPLILEKYPDAKLYTTGKKPKIPETFLEKCNELTYHSYIAKLISDYNLEDHVIFTGFLSEEKMCERYLLSNVAVSASSIEDSSNAVCEAMILGMPIVASYVGGTIDFIEHNKNGYLYQSDAPYLLAYYVCKLFEDTNNAILMGKRARRKARVLLNRVTNMNKMEEIYASIMHNIESNDY